MRPALISAVALALALFVRPDSSAQGLARSPVAPSEAAQLEALSRKMDEQNAKIDMLSQQILKLQQQLANSRPGVMIGEPAPSPAASSATASTAAASSALVGGNGNAHVVARGETLTSIAKSHNVSVSELQKFNHIDNPLRLQAGQTILIPTSPTPGGSASPTPGGSASPAE
jgi:N-acetylmuramoyl-L-alanine amidase